MLMRVTLQSAFALLAMLFIGCGAIPSGTPATVPATTDDLRWIDTLRELDEKADVVVGATNFQSSRKELSAFADAAAHAHKKRTEEIKAWRSSTFPTASPMSELPPCGQRDFRVAPKASDLEILDVFIAHRECASSYANQALAAVRASSARHVLEETARTFAAELQQLRTWRETWE